MSKFVTFANKSTLEPSTPRFVVRSQFADFTNRDKIIRWLNRIRELPILKLSERNLLAQETAELFTPAKEAFDYAYKQKSGNKNPGIADPEGVDSAGRTVLDFTSSTLKHYRKQITGIFYNNASGKQQPGSGVTSKESSSDKSVGDVLQVNSDAVKAFLEGIEGITKAVINAPLQKEMDEDYGWKAGSATIRVNNINNNRVTDSDKWFDHSTVQPDDDEFIEAL